MISRLILALGLGISALTQAAGFDHTHRLFGDILQRHVKDGLVDYAALKAAPKPLDDYLNQLGAVPEKEFMAFAEKEKIAFLINLYNASTLRLVASHYPLKSIKDIGNWLNGPFDQKVVRLMGRVFSLGDVEHAILRRNHDEPRIHFGLVCASLGCPKLRDEPYQSGKLHEQLDDQARRFLADTDKNHFDAATRTLHLSKIFKWFEKDFSRKSGSVQNFVTPYLPENIALELKKGRVQIAHTNYDWNLNEAQPAKAPGTP